jgi:hypothetical protein
VYVFMISPIRLGIQVATEQNPTNPPLTCSDVALHTEAEGLSVPVLGAEG